MILPVKLIGTLINNKEIVFILGSLASIIGIPLSWYFTRLYYLKSLSNQRKEFLITEKEYREIIKKAVEQKESDSLINNKLLEEQRISDCVERYSATGGGDFLIQMIKTYDDLSDPEKAALWDKVFLRARGRKAKNNPFR